MAKIDIKHLRRLRRVPEYPNGPCHLEIVLCGSSSISRQELASLIWTHSDEIPQIRPRLALASKWPAFTQDQYTSFSKLWPVSMRSTPGRSLSLTPDIINKIDSSKIPLLKQQR